MIRTVLFIVLACGLGACAARPDNVLLPVAVTVPGTSRVDMIVATTRLPDTSRGEMYTGERGGGLTFANIVISIPPDDTRKIGDVQWPASTPGNPATDFVAVKADRLDVAQMHTWVKAHSTAAPKHRVLVFVHGFNNRFDDAAFRFAQIVHDSGADAAPMLFTWPSRGSLFAYGYDRESTNVSRDAFEQALNMLSRDPAVSEIDILAHSMGNWLTLETLRQMAIRDRRVPVKIRNVILAAPDVDFDVFRNEIADMGASRPSFTLLVSQDDHALKVSRHIWGSVARLGAVDPEAEPYKSLLVAEHVTVIDLTKHQTDDVLNHGKFAASPELVQVLVGRLEHDQTMDNSHVGLGDSIVSATTNAAASVGTAAGLLVAAPVAVIDPTTREHLSEDVNELESEVEDTVSSVGQGPSAH